MEVSERGRENSIQSELIAGVNYWQILFFQRSQEESCVQRVTEPNKNDQDDSLKPISKIHYDLLWETFLIRKSNFSRHLHAHMHSRTHTFCQSFISGDKISSDVTLLNTTYEHNKSSYRLVGELAMCFLHVTYTSSKTGIELFSSFRDICI